MKHNIETEYDRFTDKAADACDMHLLDLQACHNYGCGEYKITSSGLYKRYSPNRLSSLGGSPAAMCAQEGGNGH